MVFGNRSQLWWDVPIIESFRVLQRLYEIPKPIFEENIEKFRDILGLEKPFECAGEAIILRTKNALQYYGSNFLHNPKIVYLDEPTIGLDAESKQRIRAFIKQMNEEKKTTFIVTSHDFQDIEDTSVRELS